MTPDDILSMLKAVENVVEAERMMDDMSGPAQIAVLRSSVRTLATVQRDLLRFILEP